LDFDQLVQSAKLDSQDSVRADEADYRSGQQLLGRKNSVEAKIKGQRSQQSSMRARDSDRLDSAEVAKASEDPSPKKAKKLID